MSKPLNSRNEWCHLVLFLAFAVQCSCHIGTKHKKILPDTKRYPIYFLTEIIPTIKRTNDRAGKVIPVNSLCKLSNTRQSLAQYIILENDMMVNGKHTYHIQTHTNTFTVSERMKDLGLNGSQHKLRIKSLHCTKYVDKDYNLKLCCMCL